MSAAVAVQTKEHPILFSGPMVRAILEGRKTQTRRVAKVTSEGCKPGYITPVAGFTPRLIANHISYCPYGQPSDRLWVRETFSAYAPEGQQGNWKTGENVTYVYRADNESADVARWYPCIFLPRRASRITLEISDIRVERLMEISDDDIRAEGVTEGDGVWDGSLRAAWANGWNAINEKRGYSWLHDPWVWVIEFKKLKV